MMITRPDSSDLEDHPMYLNVESMSNFDILRKFPIELRHLVTALILNDKIGNCADNIKITSVYNFKKNKEENTYYADSFTLRIPYAGQVLAWDIMFSHKDLLMAPDIIFDDESFLCIPNMLNTLKVNVPSLSKWNPYETLSLVNLLQEFFVLYKKYNVELLGKEERFSRFNFEYTSLVGETGISTDDVEVLVETTGMVHFLINIPIDFSQLPAYVTYNTDESENPGSDAAVLLVKFHRLDGSNIQPSLRLSPCVEQKLGMAAKKSIPSLNTQECLMDYIPELKKMLTEKVQAVIINHRMKNEYVTYLLTMHSCSVIEYDTLTFSKITLLFQNKGFCFLLTINLGNNFPQEKPEITLRSIYHFTNAAHTKPYTEQLKDYPYSPRWNPDQMVQRALTYVFENISTFQNAAVSQNL